MMTWQNIKTPVPLLVAIGVAVLGIALAGAWVVARNKENDSVALITPDSTSAMIPPIDAAAPAHIETATFALG